MADSPSTPAASEPVLDLDTLVVERPTIKIRSAKHPDGKLYTLAVMADFGIEEQQQLTTDGREFDDLWKKGSLSDDEKLRLADLLNSMYDRILLATTKEDQQVKAKLNDAQKSQVVMAFTIAPLAMAAARTEREAGKSVESQTTAN